MRKGFVLFVSFLILATMSIVSCGGNNDTNGGAIQQEHEVPSLELGRYTSKCKASHEAGRSEKTIIDIAANHIIVTKYEYKYTGALSCEEANNTSILELSYQYKKQSVFKGADLISLELKRAILTPKTEEEADAYNDEEKYDSTYWEADHGKLITEEYMEETATQDENNMKKLVKTSGNFLYVLPFTGESTADVLTSVDKYTKVNLTLTLGTYQTECDEADGLGLDHATLVALGISGPLAGQSVIEIYELKEDEITITQYYYSYEGLTPTCEEANKLYTTTAKLSYTKTTHRSGFALRMNPISGSSTIHDNGLLTYANANDVEDLYNQHGWVLNTPKDLTSFINQEAAEFSSLTAVAKTVENKLYIGPYDGELTMDAENGDSKVYTKIN